MIKFRLRIIGRNVALCTWYIDINTCTWYKDPTLAGLFSLLYPILCLFSFSYTNSFYHRALITEFSLLGFSKALLLQVSAWMSSQINMNWLQYQSKTHLPPFHAEQLPSLLSSILHQGNSHVWNDFVNLYVYFFISCLPREALRPKGSLCFVNFWISSVSDGEKTVVTPISSPVHFVVILISNRERGRAVCYWSEI